MAWQVAISLVEKVSGDDLRPKYSEFLRKGTHLDTLMMALFHLMATPPVESSMETSFDFAGNLEVSFNYEDSWNKGEERSFLDMLTPTKTHHPEANIVTTGYKIEIPTLDCGVEKSCEQPQVEMHQLAHSIYYQMLNYLPALIRSWWTLADKRTASVVERFTVSRITPLLWAEEVDRINGSSAKVHNNMTIKVRSSVREVVATYILGDDGSEGSMELPGSSTTPAAQTARFGYSWMRSPAGWEHLPGVGAPSAQAASSSAAVQPQVVSPDPPRKPFREEPPLGSRQRAEEGRWIGVLRGDIAHISSARRKLLRQKSPTDGRAAG